MRSTNTTINPQLSRIISETGHTDLLVVTDAGLPIPAGSERVDLAVPPGRPGFFDVLDTVLETAVEGALRSFSHARCGCGRSSRRVAQAGKPRYR